jgi:iron(III) transport system permease protein
MINSKKLTPLNIIFLALVIFFIAGYIAYPLLTLVRQSFTVFETEASLNSFFDVSSKSIFNSVLLSVITVIGSGFIGVYLAYIFQYRNIPLKNFLFTLLLIPIATPPLVGVVAFLFLLNDNGLLIKIISHIFNLQSPPFKFDGWTAMITIHVYSFYPFFLLFVSSALKKIDTNLIDASYSLGASGKRTFAKVIFPLLIPSITGASLIVFMASMASFTAPFIFGGSTKFLTTEIYSSKINGDTSLASLLSILLTIISLGFLTLLRFYRKKSTYEYRTKGTVKTFSSQSQKSSGFFGSLSIILFVIIIMLPLIALLFLSLIPEGSLMRNYFTEPFTADNYKKILGDSQFFEPFSNSVKMSVIAVAITILIGLSAAFLISRKKLRGKNIIESLISLPYGIPGTVIALSFIICFNTPTLFTAFIPIVGTFWILPLAYSVRNLPIITQSSIAGFNAFDPSLEEASATLGALGSRTFRKIILPMIYPSVLSGAMLVFINSVGEFVSTILLYTFSTKTISVEIYSQLRLYNTGAAAAYGVILFLLVMLIVYVSRRTLDKSVGVG